MEPMMDDHKQVSLSDLAETESLFQHTHYWIEHHLWPVHYARFLVSAGEKGNQILEVHYHPGNPPFKGYLFKQTETPLYELQLVKPYSAAYDIVWATGERLGRLDPLLSWARTPKPEFQLRDGNLTPHWRIP